MAQALLAPSRQLIVGPRGFRKPARPVLDASAPINRGLVGCWLLGDVATKGAARDIAGSAFDATLNNSPTYNQSHHGGMSLAFNGTNQYASEANCPLSSTDLTECVWAYPTDSSATLRNIIFPTSYPGVGTPVGIIYNFPSAGKWQTQPDSVTGDTLTLNAWNFLVVVYRGTAAVTLYRNGVQVGTAASSSRASVKGMKIAADTQNGRYFQGSIDGVRVYNRVLSVSEILRLYAEPYAGIYEAGPRSRVGAAAAGGATRPVKMAGRFGGYAGSSGGFAG